MRTLISGGTIVSHGTRQEASLIVEGDTIAACVQGPVSPLEYFDRTIDATGCLVFPGIIDSHVHFREPGLTAKADIESESRAAAFGGVTTYFEMPNTKPQTTTLEALDEKFSLARQKSHVNYSFFFGATNDNLNLILALRDRQIPGVKLFMGSSTGNMLVDSEQTLRQLFRTSPYLIMAHCEDTAIISANMARAKALFGDDPDVCHHPEIRSEEACWASTSLAVSLAREYGTRLHVAHVTTARELSLFGTSPNITAEATVAHLFFCDEDYARLGTSIKCNPAIKTRADREALRQALTDGRIATIGTDHAPHQLQDKQGGCARAASGMPMVQFSLVAMLELADQGIVSVEQLSQLMANRPRQLFGIRDRGTLQPGFKADIAIVASDRPWTVTEDVIQSKCGWSPMLGHSFRWRVRQTICNGQVIYDDGRFDADSRGEAVVFN